MRIQLWAPNMFEFRGGIQVYSTFLLKALCRVYPDSPIEVFLLHDRAAAGGFPPNVTFHCSGRWPRPLRKLHFAASALFAALRRAPDFVLSTHIHFGPLARFLCRRIGGRYGLVAHGVEAWQLKNGAVARAVKEADQIVAVSHFTRTQLAEHLGIPAERISVLANTFDEDRFHPGPKAEHLLRRYGLTSEHKVILSVCRLDAAERHKGYDTVLQALATLREQVPQVHYLLAGTGTDRERLRRDIEASGLTDIVTLTGFVPDSELCEHYNLCDVFTLPSTGEGFGIVFLEALACGRPVVAGNLDASAEPLGEGKYGVLVNPRSADELAGALADVLRGKFANPQLTRPEFLREVTVGRFGFAVYCGTLKNIISGSER